MQFVDPNFFALQFADWLTYKICGFSICRSIKRNFSDLKFVNSHFSEICGFVIADWAQEFVDLKAFAQPPLQICHRCQRNHRQSCRRCQQHRWQIATGINDTSSKFATSVNAIGGK
jgi:hypothetical protein